MCARWWAWGREDGRDLPSSTCPCSLTVWRWTLPLDPERMVIVYSMRFICCIASRKALWEFNSEFIPVTLPLHSFSMKIQEHVPREMSILTLNMTLRNITSTSFSCDYAHVKPSTLVCYVTVTSWYKHFSWFSTDFQVDIRLCACPLSLWSLISVRLYYGNGCGLLW